MLSSVNPLKAELNPICHLLALLGVHHILHVSRIRVNIWRFTSDAPAETLVAYNEKCREVVSDSARNHILS